MDHFRKSKILYTGERPSSLQRGRPRFRRSVRFVLSACFVLVIVGGVFYFAQLKDLQIHEIRTNGLESLPEDKILGLVNNYLNGNLFFLIPRRHFLLVSSNNIERKLMDKFSKIEGVTVRKTFDPALVIDITERKIWGIGCVKTEVEEVEESANEESRPIKTVGPCFYIDRSGFAFEEVSSFEGGLFPILYKNSGGIIGTNIFQESGTNYFEGVNQELSSALQLPVLSVEFFPEKSDEVRIMLKEGWSLLVLSNKNPSEWIPVLRTLLLGEIRNRRKQLDYLDLRFGNKVFYKYK